MCYFLYGAINESINKTEYEKVINKSKFYFNFGNKDTVNTAVRKTDDKFRITDDYCDCDSPFGSQKTKHSDLTEFAVLLKDLKKVPNISYIYVSKNWWEETNTEEETVHIDDINPITYFANIKDNCLYKIEFGYGNKYKNT